jgi:cellulose synthase/poly-beta-1,6-N-acetylglucosamine synthase-like glycosyltransferase
VQTLEAAYMAFVAALTASYACVVLYFVAGLLRLRTPTRLPPPQQPLPFVSVVVAARDEARHVDACLRALLDQDYPAERYEILLVDDHSHDDTRARADAYARGGNVRVLALQDVPGGPVTGKQNALDFGIRQSRGEVIASTDADCVAPRTWLSSVVACFDAPDVGVVVGFSMLDRPGDGGRAFVKAQSLELLSLFAAFAGSLRWNLALACTGNNLAYRRGAYEELGGFMKMGLTVAEDNMFLQWVNRHTSWKTRLALRESAFVLTEPMPSFRTFLRQRLRWASNSLENRFWAVWFMVVAYGVNAFLLVSVALATAGWLSPGWTVGVLGLKALPEAALVGLGLRRFGRRDLLPYAPFAWALHMLYVLIVGVAGLGGRVVWKNRAHRTQRRGGGRR